MELAIRSHSASQARRGSERKIIGRPPAESSRQTPAAREDAAAIRGLIIGLAFSSALWLPIAAAAAHLL